MYSYFQILYLNKYAFLGCGCGMQKKHCHPNTHTHTLKKACERKQAYTHSLTPCLPNDEGRSWGCVLCCGNRDLCNYNRSNRLHSSINSRRWLFLHVMSVLVMTDRWQLPVLFSCVQNFNSIRFLEYIFVGFEKYLYRNSVSLTERGRERVFCCYYRHSLLFHQ